MNVTSSAGEQVLQWIREYAQRHGLVLGEEGQGFQVVEDALNEARLGIAPISLGAMRHAPRHELAHS